MVEEKNEGLAAILSFLIPGLGQIYVGRVGRGIGQLIGFILGLFLFIIPGIIVWIWSTVDAYELAKKYNAERTMACPRCMNTIPRGASVCTRCGAVFMPFPGYGLQFPPPAPPPYGYLAGVPQPAPPMPTAAYAPVGPSPNPPAPPPAPARFCSRCGRQAPQGAGFCGTCGTVLS